MMRKVMNYKDAPQWEETKDKELRAMKANNIWKLVDQNEVNGSNGILYRWVYFSQRKWS